MSRFTYQNTEYKILLQDGCNQASWTSAKITEAHEGTKAVFGKASGGALNRIHQGDQALLTYNRYRRQP